MTQIAVYSLILVATASAAVLVLSRLNTDRLLATFGKVCIALCVAVAVGLVLELRWESIARRQAERIGAEIQPFYRWSFHTTRGEPVGGQTGPLALMRHPFTGYVNSPNLSLPYLHTNRYGLRAPQLADKRPGHTRIVVLGSSTAFGTGLHRDDETLAVQLERQLSRTEVINAAVIGFSSGQELAYLVTELIDLEPDVVIAVHGINDISRTGVARFREAGSSVIAQSDAELRSHYEMRHAEFGVRLARLPVLLLPHTVEWLHRHLTGPTAVGLDTLDRAPLGDEPFSLDEYARLLVANDPVSLDTQLRLYLRNVTKMATISEAYSSRFLAVIQPHPAILGGGEALDVRAENYDRFRRAATVRLHQLGIAVLDLNQHADAIEASMFLDQAHLTAEGNLAMARILATQLAKISGATGSPNPLGPRVHRFAGLSSDSLDGASAR